MSQEAIAFWLFYPNITTISVLHYLAPELVTFFFAGGQLFFPRLNISIRLLQWINQSGIAFLQGLQFRLPLLGISITKKKNNNMNMLSGLTYTQTHTQDSTISFLASIHTHTQGQTSFSPGSPWLNRLHRRQGSKQWCLWAPCGGLPMELLLAATPNNMCLLKCWWPQKADRDQGRGWKNLKMVTSDTTGEKNLKVVKSATRGDVSTFAPQLSLACHSHSLAEQLLGLRERSSRRRCRWYWKPVWRRESPCQTPVRAEGEMGDKSTKIFISQQKETERKRERRNRIMEPLLYYRGAAFRENQKRDHAWERRLHSNIQDCDNHGSYFLALTFWMMNVKRSDSA